MATAAPGWERPQTQGQFARTQNATESFRKQEQAGLRNADVAQLSLMGGLQGGIVESVALCCVTHAQRVVSVGHAINGRHTGSQQRN